MKTKKTPLLFSLAAALLWALPASASIIILDNNFNGLTTGNYTGSVGTQFGAAANLGNATGLFTTTVQGSGGVDNSQYALGISPINPAIRSRETFNAATIGAVKHSVINNCL